MLIKFKKPDPRAGTTARMDDRRLAEFFISNGSAVAVSENGDDTAPAPPAPPAPGEGEGEGGDAAKAELAARAIAFIEGNVPDVTGRIEGADEALLQAALAAENATDKPRKGVLDALAAALAPQA